MDLWLFVPWWGGLARLCRNERHSGADNFRTVAVVAVFVLPLAGLYSHVEMDGKEFDLKQGMWDKKAGAYIQPGELVNCKCTYRAVLSAFGRHGQ